MATRKRPISDGADGDAGRLRVYTVQESVTIDASSETMVLDIPAGAVILGGGAYVETAISGTGVSTATVSVGDGSDADAYLEESTLAVAAGSSAIFTGVGVGKAASASAISPVVTVGGSGSQAGVVTVVFHYALAEAPSAGA